MRLRKSESGSTLLMVIGIIAALAVMASTIVVLVINAQSGTANDRSRVKAFNIAEAALDEGMYQLSATWPITSGATVFGPAQQTAFRGRFDLTEFPNSTAGLGPFVTVRYYDDTLTGAIDTLTNYDNNNGHPNNIMWVVAQAGTGSKVARIQAKVERVLFDTPIPRGNVIYSGGPLVHNSGNEPGQVEVPYTEGPMYVKIAGSPLPNKDPVATGSGIQDPPLYGAAAGSVSSVFPDATKAGLITLAQSHGRYFTGANAINDALASPIDPSWSPQGSISGLTVIEPTVAGTLKLPPDGPINSEAKPGLIMLLKCPAPSTSTSNLDFQASPNKTDYYGVLYTDGTVDKGSGGYNVHGALIAAGQTEFQGTVNVMYNDNCIVNLGVVWSSNVKIVGNSWRELKPVSDP